MPVALQLQAFRFLGLAGEGAREVARAIVAATSNIPWPGNGGLSRNWAGWDWLKWLPHTRRPEAAQFTCLLVDDTRPPELSLSSTTPA